MARKKKEESLQDIIDHIREDLDKLEDFINERFNKLEAKLDQFNKS